MLEYNGLPKYSATADFARDAGKVMKERKAFIALPRDVQPHARHCMLRWREPSVLVACYPAVFFVVLYRIGIKKSASLRGTMLRRNLS
jgi:hypothetical protein